MNKVILPRIHGETQVMFALALDAPLRFAISACGSSIVHPFLRTFLHLREYLEDKTLAIRGDADTGVFNCHDHLILCLLGSQKAALVRRFDKIWANRAGSAFKK